MQGKSLVTLAIAALASGALVATDALAVKPQPRSGGEALVTPASMPLGVGTQDVTVDVQLSGATVAERQGAAGRKLSRSEKDQIKQQLKAAQDQLRGGIQALGGTVLANYQVAYNGIKVRIARDKAAQLATLTGVVAVRPVKLFRPTNVRSIPYIGAPAVWGATPGLRGENVKVAIIDTGIDYTHANFGGPGTVAAYDAAHANEASPADPALFGPNAPRVKGGTDLVGDSYQPDANSPGYQPTPHPDPNPLDCNGHGSHVAGTAAGSGVTAAGATYTGSYDAGTVSSNTWTIGPGVAPKADLYAVRVFGCAGPTDVVVDAIEWAVDNDMDVINMSLGAPFGSNADSDVVATNNAAKAGVIVVTSAGNEGPNPYMVGSPGVADGAIAVAATDSTASFPGATITLPSGVVTAINANGVTLAPSATYTVKVITDNPATTVDPDGSGPDSANESLGCSVAAFGGPNSLPPNTIAVVKRGTCARVAKAIFGQQAGAAAVVMVNNAAGLPPFEGPITSDPDTGVPYTVTIPFLGVSNAASQGGLMLAANGQPAVVAPASIPNPTFAQIASFSSAGPRSADSALKPDITAPGVSIVSTGNGTGNGPATISGTSMASPHVTGVAALTHEAHPSWTTQQVKAAIVNTGDPARVDGYALSRAGTGLVQPASSTRSQVTVSADDNPLAVSLNYGYAELSSDFTSKKSITLFNNGTTPAKFIVTSSSPQGTAHSVSLDTSSVSIPAGGKASVKVTVNVPVAALGPAGDFNEAAGLVEFTPATTADNAGIALRVPYYLVSRGLSNVSTTVGNFAGPDPSSVATVTNAKHTPLAGDADFYAWGLGPKHDNRFSQLLQSNAADIIRAVGVQSFPGPTAGSTVMVFAVNTYNRVSNAAANEYDIYVDVDGDGTDDYVVVAADEGAVLAGDNNGVVGSFVFSTRSAGASLVFDGTAPTDTAVTLLPVLGSQLCRRNEPCLGPASNPRITYHSIGFDRNGNVDVGLDTAKFNVWNNAISTGGFVGGLAPGATDATNVISVNSAEWAQTPAKGLMVVTFDNPSGAGEAQLIGVDVKK
ncbi:MAG TPA: S8 family serine peptidase [Casimicrobiaceae bacterium]